VKKLISIGVVLALLALVVLPVGVAAKDIVPSTYAKIPFAIVQSGFYLVGCLMGDLQTVIEDMGVDLGGIDLSSFSGILYKLGDWAGTPLAWSVDMMIAGLGMLADVVSAAGCLGLPDSVTCIGDILGVVVENLHLCYDVTAGGCNNVSNIYTITCAGMP
jgi:hypothetical protein